MLPEKIVYLGLLISFTGLFFYLKSIIYGNTRPNLVSNFIWTLAPFLGTFFQIKAGAGLSALVIFMAGFGPFIVMIVSLLKKNAYWKLNNFDLTCGLFSLVALLIYIFTHNLGVSILFAIASDALAYIPTIRKVWIFPESETWFIYVSGIISNILALLTIKDWIFTLYAFSISIIIFNSVVVFGILRNRTKPSI